MEPEHTQVAASTEPEAKPPRIAPRGFTRCRAENRSGSRCRRHAEANGLCPRHAVHLTTGGSPQDRDLSAYFSCPTNEFNSAVQINQFLSTVADLVVKNEISARRAAVLAFITNQLLRTLPEIDRETGADEPQIIFDLPRPKSRPGDDSGLEVSPSGDPLDAYRNVAT
jgi:hypothetical protein